MEGCGGEDESLEVVPDGGVAPAVDGEAGGTRGDGGEAGDVGGDGVEAGPVPLQRLLPEVLVEGEDDVEAVRGQVRPHDRHQQPGRRPLAPPQRHALLHPVTFPPFLLPSLPGQGIRAAVARG